MVHRDPETGQFVDSSSMEQYDDIEVVSFEASIGLEASNSSGGTSFGGGDKPVFQGVELIDYDEIVDRNEELRLLEAQHKIHVYANSTETADGTVQVVAEVKADPSLSSQPDIQGSGVTGDLVGDAVSDDSIDIIGRPLSATGHAPFSDSSTGVGGGGSAGEDEYTSTVFPAEMGRFHPRDELFFNGQFRIWNVDDAGSHVELSGQHTYGVISE